MGAMSKDKNMLQEEKRLERECRGCIYRKGPPTFRHCDYFGMTGRLRKCPPGKECTEKTVVTRRRRPGLPN